MIQVQKLSKSFAGQVLLEDASFIVGRGEKIGLVGRNGSGKSTLFKILEGKETVDCGVIDIPKDYKIGSLDQHINFTKETVLEECIQVLSEDEQYDHYKAEKILFGLGFTQEDLDKSPQTFSGGYQIRINLTKALLKNPDLLLLDEPTNYLDIVSMIWLRRFLKSFSGEIIIITHDREFMDAVVTHTLGITRRTLRKLKGNTHKFYERIAEDEAIYEQTRANQDKKIKEMQQFVDRFRAKASKAAQAQSRLKQLDKMGSFEKLAAEKSMGLQFHYEECPGKTLIEIDDLAFSYTGDEETLLFKDLKFAVNKNDRIGIIGKNGKGKSTLLNVIAGELSPTQGNVRQHNLVKKGHFGQTNIERLHVKNTVFEEISACNEDLGQTQIRKICGSMMFEGDNADKKINVLSGGERSRVLLGKILAHKTNLLMLDEPTNHLDMESIEVLSNELTFYEGSIIIVTHNETLLKRLVNKLIIFRNGGAELFLGTYDEFLDRIGWDDGPRVAPVKKSKAISKDAKTQRKKIINERSKNLKPLKQEILDLEELIVFAESSLEDKNKKLIEAAEKSQSDLIVTLSKDIKSLEDSIESSFDKLEVLSSECEKKENEYQIKLDTLGG